MAPNKKNNEIEQFNGDEDKCYLWDDLTGIQSVLEEIVKDVMTGAKDDKVAARPINSQEGDSPPLNTV